MNTPSVKRQRQIVSIEYLDAWKMEGDVDFEASWGASHTSQWKPAAAAAADADAAARCVHTLSQITFSLFSPLHSFL